VISVLSTSSRVGAVVASTALAPLLGKFSWQRIIQIGAGGYLAGTALAAALCGPPGRASGKGDGAIAYTGAAAKPAPAPTPAKKVASMATLLRVCATNPRVLLIFGQSTLLNPLFNFSYLLPLFLVQAKGYTAGAAAAASGALPIGATASIAVATLFWDRTKEKGRWAFCAASLLLTIAATTAVGRGLVVGKSAVFAALARPCDGGGATTPPPFPVYTEHHYRLARGHSGMTPTALGQACITGGMSATWSITGAEFVTVFGGSRAGAGARPLPVSIVMAINRRP
jgi:hypothetical protein